MKRRTKMTEESVCPDCGEIHEIEEDFPKLDLKIEPISEVIEDAEEDTGYAFSARMFITPIDYVMVGGFRESLPGAVKALSDAVNGIVSDEHMRHIAVHLHKSLPDRDKIQQQLLFSIDLREYTQSNKDSEETVQ
jgi:hypothetical protein